MRVCDTVVMHPLPVIETKCHISPTRLFAEQLEVGVDAKLLEQGDFINAKPTR